MTSTVASTTRRTPTTSSPSTTSTAAPSAPKASVPEDAEALPSTSSPAPNATKHATPEQAASATAAAKALTSSSSSEQVDAATLKLVQLPNADFAAAMKSIAAEPGALEALLAKSNNKDQLMQRLVSSGVLHTQPASLEPKPAKGPTPPPGPTLLKDDPSLPKSLRDLALKENLAKLPAYEKQHAAYAAQYKAAVDGAKSVAEVRAMGPPREPALPAMMPSTSGHIDHHVQDAWANARKGDGVDVIDKNYGQEKARELSGLPRTGLSLGLGAKVEVELNGASKFGLEGKLEDGKGSAAVIAGAGPLSGSVDNEGKTELELEFDAIKGKASDDGFEFEGGVVSAGFDKEKGASIGVEVAGVDVGGTYNGDKISYSVGVKKEVAIGDVKVGVELEGEVGIQGVTKADSDAFVSTSQVGFYDTPPELKTKSWAQLPADLKTAYVQQMWTEKEWNSARSLTLVR
jgi:hypothetical protein